MKKNLPIFIIVLLILGSNHACTTKATSVEVGQETSVQEVAITKNIGPDDFMEGIDRRKDAILLDVRSPWELAQGYLEGAININFSSPDFKNELDKLDKTKPVYIYCRSGRRSGIAMDAMKDMGFVEVYNLQGGIISWAQAGNLIIK